MALKNQENIIVLIFLISIVIVVAPLKNKIENLPKKNRMIRQSVLFAVLVQARGKRRLKECISLLNFHSTSSLKNKRKNLKENQTSEKIGSLLK